MRPGNHVRQLRHGGGALRAEDQLRRFHLDLEAEPAGRKPVDFLQPGHGEVHRLDLRHGGDLGQGQDQPGGKLAGGGERGDEQVQGPQAAGPGGRLEALEPDADERRRGAGGDGGGHSVGRGNGGGVLCLVAAVPEAVLEVEAQVLDRFAFELRLDPRRDGGGEFGVLAQQRAELSSPPWAAAVASAWAPQSAANDGVKRSAGT